MYICIQPIFLTSVGFIVDFFFFFSVGGGEIINRDLKKCLKVLVQVGNRGSEFWYKRHISFFS
jgi:hypothetical protein